MASTNKEREIWMQDLNRIILINQGKAKIPENLLCPYENIVSPDKKNASKKKL